MGTAAVVATLITAASLLLPFWRLSSHFAEQPVIQPSRLYGQPTRLEVGQLYGGERVIEELRLEGYRQATGASPPAPGRYRQSGATLTVHLRRLPTPTGWYPARLIELTYDGRRIRRIRSGGQEVAAVSLEPPLLAAYYDDDLEERRPVQVDELPEELVEAILAAEDDSFFDHVGLSVTGILRAAWVNLRGGEIRQGGSTMTQQLVKNLYLSHEQTLARKVQEAVLAVLLEARYDKRRILQAYLNEIYLGSSNGVNVIGVGAAARVYFSKEASELDLDEAATLAGMIRSPGSTSPGSHPATARERRNWVLSRMVELGWLEPERAAAIRARPAPARPHPVVRRRAPYFARAVAEEVARRFGVLELADRGYTLLSTLDPDDQAAAREAVRWGVEALEKGWEKGSRAGGPLEAALVSVDPERGAILAYVGGRDYARSQFDRAGQARRQAGSAFKPVVYAAAFEEGIASPATFVEDAPLTVRLAGQRWSPRNSDGDYRGWVTARTALEKSLNTATARVALQTGLSPIVELAHRMGVGAHLEPVPALALGAFEVTPLELATVYATLAAGGVRPPVHGLEAVLDPEGRPVTGEPLAEAEPALSPQAAYLVTSILEGVLERGTARGVRRMGLDDPLAGKTGTSNERRDSWFGGYAPNRATAVWVGYDDNSPTRLSGARAGLPIWARFTAEVRPPGGYPVFRQPPGIVTAVVDPETGGLATDACPEVITEVFRRGEIPHRVCHLHRGRFTELLDPPPGYERQERRPRRHPFRRWLDRIFGDGR